MPPASTAPTWRSVAEIHRMFAQIDEQHGRLDALVNNAARFTRFDPLDITEADWDFIHSVNLKSVFFTAQAAAKMMLGGVGLPAYPSGRIVNIASLGGIRPWAEHAHYCASKAGVIMLTKALAKAWAPRLTVNCSRPRRDPVRRHRRTRPPDDPQHAGTAWRHAGRGRGRCRIFPHSIEFHHRAGTSHRRRT